MQIDPTEPHPARRYRAGQNEAAKLNRFRCRSRRLSPPVVAREQDVRSGNSPFFDDFACLFGERCLSTQPGAGERKLPASPQCGGCGRRFCAFGNEVLFVGGQFRSERIVPRLQQVGLGAAIRTWVAANSASVHASRIPRIAGRTSNRPQAAGCLPSAATSTSSPEFQPRRPFAHAKPRPIPARSHRA